MGRLILKMKNLALALLLSSATAIKLDKKESPDCPTSNEVFSYNESVASAAGFLQTSACIESGVHGMGVSCVPQHELFATGMNGDEDLGEDITMKGENSTITRSHQTRNCSPLE